MRNRKSVPVYVLYALRNNLRLTRLLNTHRVGAEGGRPHTILRAAILAAKIRLAEIRMMNRRGKRCGGESTGAVADGPRRRLLRRPQIQRWG